MKAIHAFFVLFLIGFTVSCASIYDVKYDFDQQANFADLKTFDWMPVPEKAGINSLVVQRVKKAVNAELQAKGLMMTSNNPDFIIAQHLRKKDKVQFTDREYGPGYRGGSDRPNWVSSYEYVEGSLILDFVDANSKKMIWQGAAKAEVQNIDTPEKCEKLIHEAVQEILKNFPPKPKG